jgi:hypothetical protein
METNAVKIATYPTAALIAFSHIACGADTSGSEPLATSGLSVSRDYSKRMREPESCGNDPYLARLDEVRAEACKKAVFVLRTTVLSAGLSCDHVIAAMPNMQDTPVSEVICVVRGGDIIVGRPTNMAEYVITSSQVIRLPESGQQEAVQFAILHAHSIGQRSLEPHLWVAQAKLKAAAQQRMPDANNPGPFISAIHDAGYPCEKISGQTKSTEFDGWVVTCNGMTFAIGDVGGGQLLAQPDASTAGRR